MARSKIGVSADGSHNAFAKSGEPTLAVHHDPNRARAGDKPGAGLARSGAPKRLHPVSIHNGMTERQQALQGMGHATAVGPDANPANPMSKEPGRKEFPAAKPAFGMKQPTSDLGELGAAVLSEALNGSPHWRA